MMGGLMHNKWFNDRSLILDKTTVLAAKSGSPRHEHSLGISQTNGSITSCIQECEFLIAHECSMRVVSGDEWGVLV